MKKGLRQDTREVIKSVLDGMNALMKKGLRQEFFGQICVYVTDGMNALMKKGLRRRIFPQLEANQDGMNALMKKGLRRIPGVNENPGRWNECPDEEGIKTVSPAVFPG